MPQTNRCSSWSMMHMNSAQDKIRKGACMGRTIALESGNDGLPRELAEALARCAGATW